MGEGVPSIHSWVELHSVVTHLLLQQILAEFLQQWQAASGQMRVGDEKIPVRRPGGLRSTRKILMPVFPAQKRNTAHFPEVNIKLACWLFYSGINIVGVLI